MGSSTFGLMSAPGDPMTLGVSRCGKKHNFAVSVPNAGECRLKIEIYNKDSEQQEETTAVFVMTKENRFGSIFSLSIIGLEEKKFFYWYEALGREFADPYARQLADRGDFGNNSSAGACKAIAARDTFSWNDDVSPRLSYQELILYKLHVRGFTRHPSAHVRHPGTFAGVCEKIRYMKELGINAILLMPCYDFDELCGSGGIQGIPQLTDTMRAKGVFRHTMAEHEKGSSQKVNYWGYGAKSFYFAPKASYAADPWHACKEFKTMVSKMHTNGIEVLMEIDFARGTAYSLILDVLRFWVTEYHIDGFRINAETAPGLLTGADPFLADTKLLAAGWDTDSLYGSHVTPDYQNLAECNEGFLNDCRRFMKGDEAQIRPFTGRVVRNPSKCAVVNYITDHNGFTLYDLFTYDRKHNEKNGERNQDGTDYNYSWNCGAEGETTARRVQSLRLQMIKNALIALFLSQGTPMLLAGDEFLNSQYGNNNAYCQDNEISWLDWKRTKNANACREFIAMLISLRKKHPVFHNTLELKQMDYISNGCPDISYHGVKAWYPDYANYCRTVGILLNGAYAKISRTENDQSFYLIYNMHWEPHAFDLPYCSPDKKWEILIATSQEDQTGSKKELQLLMQPRSVAVCVAVDREKKGSPKEQRIRAD